MAARQQIPEAQGVQDTKVRDILTTMRTIINNITGRSNKQIQSLGATSDIGGVINKVNEIINTLQEGSQVSSSGKQTSNPSEIRLNTANGYGSTNTKYRRFTNVELSQGSDISYSDSATNGAIFTINTSGVYSISYSDNFSAGCNIAIGINDNQGTTSPTSSTITNIVTGPGTTTANQLTQMSLEDYFYAGTTIVAKTDGVSSGSAPTYAKFIIIKK